MKQFLLPAVAALAVFALTSGAKAQEINLGSFSPGVCVASTTGTDEGRICGAGAVVLSSGPDIFDVSGFSDHFITAAATTFKPGPGSSLTPLNTAGESGFGENALGATACTDVTTCEIAGNASVAISSNIGLIDAVVGSVQAGENFTVWAGNSLATLAPVASSSGGSCTSNGVTDECLVNFGAASIVGLTSGGTGDVLLSAISVPSAEVPEPASMAVLGFGLLGLTAALRRRRHS